MTVVNFGVMSEAREKASLRQEQAATDSDSSDSEVDMPAKKYKVWIFRPDSRSVSKVC